MSGLQWQELVLVSPELCSPTMRIQVETARPRHQTPGGWKGGSFYRKYNKDWNCSVEKDSPLFQGGSSMKEVFPI